MLDVTFVKEEVLNHRYQPDAQVHDVTIKVMVSLTGETGRAVPMPVRVTLGWGPEAEVRRVYRRARVLARRKIFEYFDGVGVPGENLFLT